MAYKLGVDLIEKARVGALLAKPGIKRRFTAAELAYAEGSNRPEEALAAAFAAKEAFFKALSGLPIDTQGVFWQAELRHNEAGRPYLNLPPKLAESLRAAGVANIEISLSHDREQVLAAVLLSDGAEGAAVLRGIAPRGFVPLAAGAPRLLDAKQAAAWLPLRDGAAHKGSFGHLLVVGGSAQYPGAPKMAAEAALRAGAGLVTLAAPAAVSPLSAEVIHLPLDAPQGFLDEGLAPALKKAAGGKVPVIGMGLGRAPGTVQLCAELFALPGSKVIDADGLFALSQLDEKPVSAVLTPHEGEMARLFNTTAAEVAADRIGYARRGAERFGAVLVLKGAGTLIAAPNGEVWQNTTGNPGMATGGSGDVLAGIIGAWLAQGMPPARAAAFGVYLHGLAGDLAAAELSQYAMTALDIVRYLPQAYRQLLAIKWGNDNTVTLKNI